MATNINNVRYQHHFCVKKRRGNQWHSTNWAWQASKIYATVACLKYTCRLTASLITGFLSCACCDAWRCLAAFYTWLCVFSFVYFSFVIFPPPRRKWTVPLCHRFKDLLTCWNYQHVIDEQVWYGLLLCMHLHVFADAQAKLAWQVAIPVIYLVNSMLSYYSSLYFI